MGGASETLHEPAKKLSGATREAHRALASLREELEAVDWYRQRVDACSDDALREVLAHNLREETEHACMLLEWLRRNDAGFEHQLRAWLFVDGDLAGRVRADEGDGAAVDDDGHGADDAAVAGGTVPLRTTIGSLKVPR